MAKPSVYGSVARLCEMYMAQYRVYTAVSRPPRMDRAEKIAAQELDELMQSLERLISPINFQQSLDAEAAKENLNG